MEWLCPHTHMHTVAHAMHAPPTLPQNKEVDKPWLIYLETNKPWT